MALFSLSPASQLALFFVLHYFILRIFLKRSLLYCSAFAVFIGTGIVVLPSYFLVAGMFSSLEAYAVSVIGSSLASPFACGLYTFLGPATADKSLACQMLVSLREGPRGKRTREELLRGFDPDGFVEKRLECKKPKGLRNQPGD